MAAAALTKQSARASTQLKVRAARNRQALHTLPHQDTRKHRHTNMHKHTQTPPPHTHTQASKKQRDANTRHLTFEHTCLQSNTHGQPTLQTTHAQHHILLSNQNTYPYLRFLECICVRHSGKISEEGGIHLRNPQYSTLSIPSLRSMTPCVMFSFFLSSFRGAATVNRRQLALK